MKLIVFSHGKESGPNGNKISSLRKVAESQGYTTHSLDYRACESAAQRVELLKSYTASQEYESIILVGSSMGGYVSTVVANELTVDGLFLLCPALYMPAEKYAVLSYHPKCSNIEIVHGWDDEIVPYENSLTFGKQTKATINLVADNHRLSQSIDFIAKRFDIFLSEFGK